MPDTYWEQVEKGRPAFRKIACGVARKFKLDPDDLLQNAILRAQSSWKGEVKITWMSRILRCTAIDMYRLRNRRVHTLSFHGVMEDGQEMETFFTDPWPMIDERLEMERKLSTLTERQLNTIITRIHDDAPPGRVRVAHRKIQLALEAA